MKDWLKCLSSALFFALASPLFAELGGPAETVHADQARIGAALTSTQAQRYTVYELSTPGRTVVREYVSASGVVFGVAWQGPFVPNLRQLFGTYFPHYSRAVKRSGENRGGRDALTVDEPNLAVHSSGHMRSYYGRAYDPQLLPAEVSPDEIR